MSNNINKLIGKLLCGEDITYNKNVLSNTTTFLQKNTLNPNNSSQKINIDYDIVDNFMNMLIIPNDIQKSFDNDKYIKKLVQFIKNNSFYYSNLLDILIKLKIQKNPNKIYS